MDAFFLFHARRRVKQKNRAFRSKSSEAPLRFLWAFRYNPLRRPAANRAPVYAKHTQARDQQVPREFAGAKSRGLSPCTARNALCTSLSLPAAMRQNKCNTQTGSYVQYFFFENLDNSF
jgi:hypothetical protein